MSRAYPPEAVLLELLHYLSETVDEREPVILILRGSLLLRHWFGQSARPAADIDLECFERVRGHRGNRFESLHDHARGLCCFATEMAWRHREAAQYVEFDEVMAPEDGESLWTYGSPGQRYYVGWTWHGGEEQAGRLQIDLAESRSYDLSDISVANAHLVSLDGSLFRFPSYTPEMMLAAKLSWLVRSFRRQPDGSAPEWKREPKDLFDAHLLLTKADLRAEVIRKSLLAVGAEDELDWNNLQALFDVRWADRSDADFPDWTAFRDQHPRLVTSGPVELLRTIADRLEPLLGDFYLRAEMPFLLAINAEPADELTYLIYSDWLEEHDERRGHFLRQFTRLYFRADELPPRQLVRERKLLHKALPGISVHWLLQLFGTSARMGDVLRSIGGPSS
jgi:uncharacterized protein (TIGR02996 family)